MSIVEVSILQVELSCNFMIVNNNLNYIYIHIYIYIFIYTFIIEYMNLLILHSCMCLRVVTHETNG